MSSWSSSDSSISAVMNYLQAICSFVHITCWWCPLASVTLSGF
uniref:Uncharacterized protein n=1 Tax=Anguilla anguilla TaxID=7936 RepID=A0A0E9SDL3_ANGAN